MRPPAPEPAQAQAQVQEPTATPPRSVLAQIGRWLTGADRREAQDQAEAQAAREHEAASQVMRELNRRIEAQRQAQREQEDRYIEAAHARAAAEQAQREQARRDRVDAGLQAVAVSEEPLVRIVTEAGTTYHMRRADWIEAQESGAVNVPLCSWTGGDVLPGERARMRVSTVATSLLEPRAVPTADEYLHQETAAEEEELRPRGPRLSM